MQSSVEIDRDVATSLPGTSGVGHKKKPSENKSTYRLGAKVLKTGTSPSVQKKPLFISDNPLPKPSRSERGHLPGHSNANLRQREYSVSPCAKLFNRHRIACIFFGVISLVLNTIFMTVFVHRWRSTVSIQDAPKLAIVGCATSIIFGISSSCLVVGSALRLRGLLWLPMVLTLVQFIPATMFVFVLAEINHASTWVSVTTSCVLGIVVLALSFYQLLQVVSLYVDLGQNADNRANPSS